MRCGQKAVSAWRAWDVVKTSFCAPGVWSNVTAFDVCRVRGVRVCVCVLDSRYDARARTHTHTHTHTHTYVVIR